jgi:hypothetical protein
MKTKTFLLLCLCLGIGLTQLTAQVLPPDIPTGTKSVSFRFEVTTTFWTPLYCGDELYDILGGTLKLHHIWHYDNGLDIWCVYQAEGELTGKNTNEVFKYKENGQRHFHHDNCFVTFTYNAKGNKGTHLTGSMTWDFCTDPDMENMVIDRAICN